MAGRCSRAAAVWAVACAALVLGNARAGTPGAHVQVDVPVALLEGYVGSYQLGASAVLTIKREGQQLSAQLSGQPALPIYPESEAEFFYKAVDAQITFETDASGRAAALVIHQNGADVRAVRMDPAVAEQRAAALAARVHAQQPSPGSEDAARRFLKGIEAGNPAYDEMSPELAAAVRKQCPALQETMTRLGPITSVEFRSVGNEGWDVFEVMHAKGVSQLRIALDGNGKIIGALQSVGP